MSTIIKKVNFFFSPNFDIFGDFFNNRHLSLKDLRYAVKYFHAKKTVMVSSSSSVVHVMMFIRLKKPPITTKNTKQENPATITIPLHFSHNFVSLLFSS